MPLPCRKRDYVSPSLGISLEVEFDAGQEHELPFASPRSNSPSRTTQLGSFSHCSRSRRVDRRTALGQDAGPRRLQQALCRLLAPALARLQYAPSPNCMDLQRTAAVMSQRTNRIDEFIIADEVEWEGWLISRRPLHLGPNQIVQPQASAPSSSIICCAKVIFPDSGRPSIATSRGLGRDAIKATTSLNVSMLRTVGVDARRRKPAHGGVCKSWRISHRSRAVRFAHRPAARASRPAVNETKRLRS